MNSRCVLWLVVVTILTISISSCHVIKRVIYFNSDHPKGEKEVLSLLRSGEYRPDFLSLKTKVEAKEGDQKQSFKTNIRVKRDSAIWMSITPIAGIEVVRVLITKDSVKFVNRLEKTYFLGEFDYLNRTFNIDVNFEIIQSLLLGNATKFEDDGDLKLSYKKDKEEYLLSSVRKRKLKRKLGKRDKITEEKLEEKQDKFDFIAFSYWVDQNTMRVARVAINDVMKNRSLTAEYSNFKIPTPPLLDMLFAHQASFVITSDSSTYSIKAKHLKVTALPTTRFPFKIPVKYAPAQ